VVVDNVFEPAVDGLKTLAQAIPIPGITESVSLSSGPRTFDFKFPIAVAADPDAPWPNARVYQEGHPAHPRRSCGSRSRKHALYLVR
jgi:hypothetical protein